MRKIKIFRSGGGFDLLETQVNLWLEDNINVKIFDVRYQDNISYCSLIFFYDNTGTIPKGLRKGQIIFNFLAWLKKNNKITSVANQQNDMIDPFYIEDKDWYKLYEEFLNQIKNGNR